MVFRAYLLLVHYQRSTGFETHMTLKLQTMKYPTCRHAHNVRQVIQNKK